MLNGIPRQAWRKTLAALNSTPVVSHTGGGAIEPLPQLRTLAGLGSMLPVAAGALGVGLLTGSKRTGVNFFTANWPQLMLATGGVSISVVGEQNLHVQRPAVFIFNHRNSFDVFVAAALVRENWTAVGKKELEKDLVAGTIGRIVDAAFIERDDPEKSVAGLHKVEELARRGLSVVIAPEGTRTGASEVGPFKKGPFRIAMTVGIPIVPIVIRNAEVMGDRTSMILHRGTVDVAVLPPVPVDGWTVAKLPHHIEQIRQLYIDTLQNWPTRPTSAIRVGGGHAAPAEAQRQSSTDAPPPKRAPVGAAEPPKRQRSRATTQKVSNKATAQGSASGGTAATRRQS